MKVNVIISFQDGHNWVSESAGHTVLLIERFGRLSENATHYF